MRMMKSDELMYVIEKLYWVKFEKNPLSIKVECDKIKLMVGFSMFVSYFFKISVALFNSIFKQIPKFFLRLVMIMASKMDSSNLL